MGCAPFRRALHQIGSVVSPKRVISDIRTHPFHDEFLAGFAVQGSRETHCPPRLQACGLFWVVSQALLSNIFDIICAPPSRLSQTLTTYFDERRHSFSQSRSRCGSNCAPTAAFVSLGPED